MQGFEDSRQVKYWVFATYLNIHNVWLDRANWHDIFKVRLGNRIKTFAHQGSSFLQGNAYVILALTS